MSDINLNNLTVEELKEQARILGLDTKGSADTLRTKIREALGEEVETTKPVAKSKDTVVIIIAEDEKDQQPAYVGVNGKSYRIRRGEEVEVPKTVVEVLQMAKQRVRDAKGNWKFVPTYPFSVVG